MLHSLPREPWSFVEGSVQKVYFGVTKFSSELDSSVDLVDILQVCLELILGILFDGGYLGGSVTPYEPPSSTL